LVVIEGDEDSRIALAEERRLGEENPREGLGEAARPPRREEVTLGREGIGERIPLGVEAAALSRV
jgi:hypothetical protein